MLSSFVLLLAQAIARDIEATAEIVARIKHGDGEAFRALFDLFHGDLYRFLLRMGVSEAAAEDILQDVFAGIWSGRSRLDASRSIRAYLYRSCRNRAANYFRSRSRVADDLVEEPPSPLPSQQERLEHTMLLEHLHDAVAQLPERRRAVFELCFIEGLSYKEASDILEISPKTIENQMGYAFKAIRQQLAPHLEEE